MCGRLLLAILFCVTAWATLAQMLPTTPVTKAPAADAFPQMEAGAPGSTGDSDSRWDAGDRASASVTESLWKSSVVHAQLAGARSGKVFIGMNAVARRDRPTRDGSAHLIHIPLLI